MKRIIVLALAFALCLSLSACGKSEAVKNVEAMIDALGEITLESEPAVAAAEAAYQALADEEKSKVGNIDVLTEARERITILSYAGEWVLVSDAHWRMEKLHLYEDFTVDSEIDLANKWELVDNGIYFPEYWKWAGKFERKTIDGIDHLISVSFDDPNGMGSVPTVQNFVRPKDANITEHEITIDNWQTYFEIVELCTVEKNGFGDIENCRNLLLLVPRAEYLDRLVPFDYIDERENKISIEVQYQESKTLGRVSEDSKNVVWGNVIQTDEDMSSDVVDILLCDMYLYSHPEFDWGDLPDVYPEIANEWGSYSDEHQSIVFYTMDNFVISRIAGTLPLSDNPVLACK